MTPPRISLPQCGPHPAHVAEIVGRLGDPSDPAGEHVQLRIVECPESPEAVGRTYRKPCRGGHPCWSRLTAEHAQVAQQVPHLQDVLARGGRLAPAEKCSTTTRLVT